MAKGAKKAAARCGISASATGENKRLMFRCSLWLAAYRKAISEKCLSPLAVYAKLVIQPVLLPIGKAGFLLRFK